MLACARIGASIHCLWRIAANELAVRIDDATPKAILSASCGIEPGRVIAYKPLVDAAIELATHKPNCGGLPARTAYSRASRGAGF